MPQLSSVPSQRQSVFLLAAVLYLLFWQPLWQWLSLDLAAVTLAGMTLYLGGYKQYWQQFRPVLVVFALLIIVDAITASLLKRSVVVSVHLLKALLLYVPVLFAIHHSSAQQRLRLLRLMLLAALLLWMLVLAGVSLSDLAMTRSRILEHYSAQWVGNLHNLANAVALSLLAALVLLYCDTKRGWQGIAIVTLLVTGTLLVIAASEGSLIGLLAALAAISIMAGPRWLKLLAIAGLAVMVLSLHLLYFQPQLMLQWLGISMHSFDERVQIYQQLLQYWWQSPWFGYGMGSYKFLPVSSVGGNNYLYPHHIYLEGLFSLGLLGMLLLLAMFRPMVKTISRSAVVKDPLALLSLLVLSYSAAKGMTDMKLLTHHTFSAFIVPLAIMTAVSNSTRLKTGSD